MPALIFNSSPASCGVVPVPGLVQFDLARIGRGLLDQLLNRLNLDCAGTTKTFGEAPITMIWDEVLERVVRHFRIEARVDDEGARAEQQRIAVRRGARDDAGADRAAGAAAVFDDHRLAEGLAELLVDHARGEIGAAARRETGDDGDRAFGILAAGAAQRRTANVARAANAAGSRIVRMALSAPDILNMVVPPARCCLFVVPS